MRESVDITFGIEGMDWQALADLLRRGFQHDRSLKLLIAAFSQSYACCFAWYNGELVGAARAISDGVISSAIYDVVVDPDYQRQGIGRKLMEALLSRLPKRSVMLVSTHGNEEFYRKLGFRKLRTAYMLQDNFQAWEAGGYFDD
ncbi:MAG: GNAT family N-acetyltransferase [Caldilineaceae bacterium]